MMKTPRLAFVTAALLLAVPASAQPPRAGAPSVRDALDAGSRDIFDTGTRLYREGRYAEARESFLAAHRASGDRRVLYNVAVCDKALGHYARAIAMLQRSVADRTVLPAEYTRRVDDALATLSSHVAFVKLVSGVLDVTYTIDGEPIAQNPVAVDAGSHTIAGRKEGYEPDVRTVTAKEGESLEVSLSPTAVARARVACATGVPCEIHVGEDALGVGPVTFSRPPGVYVVRARVHGEAWSEQRVELQAGRTTEVVLAAAPVAHLRITTERPDDSVIIDGQVAGRSGAELTVAPGEHRVFISRRDGASKSLDLLLRDHETRDLRVTVGEEKTGISPWWFVGGGVVLAAIGTSVALVATRSTKFEGNVAGTLNPYVVPAWAGGGRFR